MIDTRVFFFVVPADSIGHSRFWAPVAFHDPGFIAQNGEGWTPVSHTLMSYGDDGSALITIMCNREIEIDDPS